MKEMTSAVYFLDVVRTSAIFSIAIKFAFASVVSEFLLSSNLCSENYFNENSSVTCNKQLTS